MDVLILTHGAGSNREAPLLRAVASAIERPELRVERVNLAFRERKAGGPPSPADGLRDREGLRQEVARARESGASRVFLGGVSYGGRQASMLLAEEPAVADGLVLLSYPLHPPGRADKPRTAHLSKITTPVLFVHGERDPFGSIEELTAALELIPGRKRLVAVAGVGHDLGGGKGPRPAMIAQAFAEFFS